MVPISVAVAAAEDDQRAVDRSWVKKVVGTKQRDEATVAASE